MASQTDAGKETASTLTFGAWLRQLREERDLAQRVVAAAADMDSSHYGKVEANKRTLTEPQLVAVAKCLGQPEPEMRRRWLAAQWLRLCDGNHALASDTAALVQEHAAPYLVNKPANNRPKKK